MAGPIYIGYQLKNQGGTITISPAVASDQAVTLGQATTALASYVPYTGATGNVDLGLNQLTATTIVKAGGTAGQFLKANGTVDSSIYLTGNQTITLSGEATGAGPTGIPVTLTNSAVIAKVLTGFLAAPGTVSATDSILTAIQKIVGNVLITTQNNLTGQSAAIPSLVTVTPSATTTYEVGGYLTVTAVTAGTAILQLNYTDETSTPRSINVVTASATGLNDAATISIRALSGSPITWATTFAGVSVAYDIGAWIRPV